MLKFMDYLENLRIAAKVSLHACPNCKTDMGRGAECSNCGHDFTDDYLENVMAQHDLRVLVNA